MSGMSKTTLKSQQNSATFWQIFELSKTNRKNTLVTTLGSTRGRIRSFGLKNCSWKNWNWKKNLVQIWIYRCGSAYKILDRDILTRVLHLWWKGPELALWKKSLPAGQLVFSFLLWLGGHSPTAPFFSGGSFSSGLGHLFLAWNEIKNLQLAFDSFGPKSIWDANVFLAYISCV